MGKRIAGPALLAALCACHGWRWPWQDAPPPVGGRLRELPAEVLFQH